MAKIFSSSLWNDDDDDEKTTTRSRSGGIFGTSLWNEDAEEKPKKVEAKKKEKGKNVVDRAGDLLSGVGRAAFGKTAQTINTAVEGVETGLGLLDIARSSIFESDEDYEKTVDRRYKEAQERKKKAKDGGLFGAGQLDKEGNYEDMSTGDVAKKIVGGGIGVGTEVVPALRGYRLATQAAKNAGRASTLFRGAVEGAALGTTGQVAENMVSGEGDFGDIAQSAAFGGVLGGVGAEVGRMIFGRKPQDPAVTDVLDDKAINDITKSTKIKVKGTSTTTKGKVGEVLPDAKEVNPADYDFDDTDFRIRFNKQAQQLAKSNPAIADAFAKTGSRDPLTLSMQTLADTDDPKSLREAVGTFIPELSDGQRKRVAQRLIDEKDPQKIAETMWKASVDARGPNISGTPMTKKITFDSPEIRNKTPLRELPEDVPATKAAQKDATVKKAVVQEAEDMDRYFASADKNFTPGLMAGVTTPERVFQRAGLSDVFDKVREGFDASTRATNGAVRQIGTWAERMDKNSSQMIFRAMNGERVTLNANDQAIADEMRSFLRTYAERLGLPEEKRITDYIPHLFESNGKRIDPELQRLLKKNAGSDVTSANLKKRLGNEGYKEDVLEALTVYAQRAERQINMQEGMNLLQASKKKVSQEMATYINDQMNIIKNTPDAQAELTKKLDTTLAKIGIKEGSLEKASNLARGIIYRATLGFNTGSALRNFSQSTNTFSQLGSVWTSMGAAQAAKTFVTRNVDELVEMNVLDDTLEKALRQARPGANKAGKVINKADDLLWLQFQTAEHMNRATAYFGAKAKALAAGKTEAQARKAGAALARKTQFKFSPIDTPHMLHGPISKNLTQFMSFNIKQVEYLKDMVVGSEGMFQRGKNGRYTLSPKGTWRMARLVGGNMAFMMTAGSLLGMEPEDFIPFYADLKEGGVPTSPLVQIALGDKKNLGIANIVTGKDQYGTEKGRGEIFSDFVNDELIGLTVPGGTQTKKTMEGLGAVDAGVSETKTGNVRYPISQTDANRVRAGIFGQYNTPEGEAYFDRGGEALSPTQSTIFREAPPAQQQAYYEAFTELKGQGKEKQNVGKEIRNAVAAKQFQRGRRLADEHNARIDSVIDALKAQTGSLPEEIEDYLRQEYKVNYDYYYDRRNS